MISPKLVCRELGVTHVLATTACGSLREAITPGLFLLPSSFIGSKQPLRLLKLIKLRQDNWAATVFLFQRWFARSVPYTHGTRFDLYH